MTVLRRLLDQVLGCPLRDARCPQLAGEPKQGVVALAIRDTLEDGRGLETWRGVWGCAVAIRLRQEPVQPGRRRRYRGTAVARPRGPLIDLATGVAGRRCDDVSAIAPHVDPLDAPEIAAVLDLAPGVTEVEVMSAPGVRRGGRHDVLAGRRLHLPELRARLWTVQVDDHDLVDAAGRDADVRLGVLRPPRLDRVLVRGGGL